LPSIPPIRQSGTGILKVAGRRYAVRAPGVGETIYDSAYREVGKWTVVGTEAAE